MRLTLIALLVIGAAAAQYNARPMIRTLEAARLALYNAPWLNNSIISPPWGVQ